MATSIPTIIVAPAIESGVSLPLFLNCFIIYDHISVNHTVASSCGIIVLSFNQYVNSIAMTVLSVLLTRGGYNMYHYLFSSTILPSYGLK